MSLIGILVAKDLRRAWRNPIPYVIHLAMPVLITALIGLAFGRSASEGGLGRIRLAIVDEDDSPLTRFLRGALNQADRGKSFDPVFTTREAAMRDIAENRLSAVAVIPRDFTRHYLTGDSGVTLELVKNPAQSFHPAIVEEMLQMLVTALNAVARNFQSDFPEWQAAFNRPGGPDFTKAGSLMIRSGEKLQAAQSILFPPLVGLEKEQRPDAKKIQNPGWNVFAFILPGMAAVFLLFLADVAVRDLYREGRFGTLERFHSLRQGLRVFVSAKVVFALVILLIGAAILLEGGALMFRFQWKHPVPLVFVALAYAFFAAGFMALMAALAGKEKRADVLNNVVAMGLGLAGGCMFPAEQLPGFLREHITPLMPTQWFTAAVRGMESGMPGHGWVWTSLELAILGWALISMAAWLFHRRIARGIR
jgi:ABC-type multidrug transport system permease subunit